MPEPYRSAFDGIPGAGPYPRTSRYADAEIAVHTLPGGAEVRYAKHRLLPPLPAADDTVPHTVTAVERPDHLGQRYFGAPDQWWRIADANPVLDPRELTAEPGRRIGIPGQGGGLG
ncbi:LysM domain-containing protein [Actinoplanes sp. GCM10030250]|uniref:LysM domain-containing protein n=1 Tax=Actinoplanes sp. GCM10030250 TaxID=3273376 RepID=UPI00361FD915